MRSPASRYNHLMHAVTWQKKVRGNSFPLMVFALGLATLWGWMRFIHWLLPIDLSPDPALRPHMGVAPETHPWLSLWQRWDTLHYQAIAGQGYAAFDTSLFTPPLYPFLMRVFGAALGGNTLLGGWIVSLLFCAAALTAFYRLAQFELKDEILARRAVAYLALFPTAFFLFAPYTESLFMLGSAMCLLTLREKNWLAAGAWGALAASARLTGAVLFLPVAWCAWQAWGEKRVWMPWLAAAFVAAASIAFPLYAWLGLGTSILAPFEAQSQRFHGGFAFPGVNIIAALRQAFSGNFPITNLLDVFFTLLFIWLGVLVWKRLPRVYGIYHWAYMALYLTRIADVYPLLSMARYVLALFPAFFVLAQYGENPVTRRVIVYASIPGALFLSAQFAIWGWVG